MNLLVLSSFLFGCIGVYIIHTTNRVVGYGILLVSITSLLYHNTYHPILRYIDNGSNLCLGCFFLLQQGVSFSNWLTRMFWGCIAMLGYVNTLYMSSEHYPYTHFSLIHLPVLMGFYCIVFE